MSTPTDLVIEGCPWPAVYGDCGGVCDAFTQYPDPAAAQALWEGVAGDLLWNWTNRVYGVCEVEVRPCGAQCAESFTGWSTYWGRGPGYDPYFPGGGGSVPRGSLPWYPVLVAGKWFNITCGCTGVCQCSPSGPTVLSLPGPVQSVTEVRIDGGVLDPTLYHVVQKRWLVRDDGEVWPRCQNMLKPVAGGYEPVTVPTGTQSEGTFTRVGDVVTGVVRYTAGPGGANFVGAVPWKPHGMQVVASVYNASGAQTGTFMMSDIGALSGSSAAGFADIEFGYITDAPASAVDASDTFQVTYQKGLPVPIGGQVATGRLACELALAACGSEECALPERMQSLSRQGISIGFQDLSQDTIETGIWSIDSWVGSATKPRSYASVRSVDMG